MYSCNSIWRHMLLCKSDYYVTNDFLSHALSLRNVQFSTCSFRVRYMLFCNGWINRLSYTLSQLTWLSEVGFSTQRSRQNSRVEFKNEMSDLVGFESPKIDWTPGPGLPHAEVQAFSTEMWTIWWTTQGTNQRAWPSLDRRIRSRLVQHLELELWRTKTRRILKRFEEYVKPQSNHIPYYFYLT